MSFSALIISRQGGGGGGQSFGMSLTQRFLDDFISLHHHQCRVFSLISQQYTNHTFTQEKENVFQFDSTGDATTQLVFLGTITASGLYFRTLLNRSLVVLFPQLQRGNQELKQSSVFSGRCCIIAMEMPSCRPPYPTVSPSSSSFSPGTTKSRKGGGRVSVSPLAPGPLSLVQDGPWGA